jgi:hypothetical protein
MSNGGSITDPSTPMSAAEQAMVDRQIAGLHPRVRAAIAQAAAQSQRTVLDIPYWSTVRLAAAVAAGPPVVLTVDTTPRKAFQYAVGQDMGVAGRPGVLATYADTSLLRAGETLDNQDVWIDGLCLEVCPNSEPALVGALFRETLVEISLNGTQSIKLGTINMFPGGGGPYGIGQSASAEPDLQTTGIIDGGGGTPYGYVQNGNPMAGNFYKFKKGQGFKWSAIGSGNSDASLSLIFTPTRQIVDTLALARAAAAGVAPWTPPAAAGDPGTFLDIRARLVSTAVGRRSVNT